MIVVLAKLGIAQIKIKVSVRTKQFEDFSRFIIQKLGSYR